MPGYEDAILAAVLAAGRKTAELIDLRDELAERLPGEIQPPESPYLRGPVLNIVEQVVRGIRDGTPLNHVYPDISRLTNNQEQRAEMIDQLMLTHEYTRYVDTVKARDRLEQELLEACRGSKTMTPMEQVVVLREVSKIVVQIENRIRAGAVSIKDIVSQLQKIDWAVSSTSEADLQRRFANTSPQAREITRKLLTKLRKVVVQNEKPATDLE